MRGVERNPSVASKAASGSSDALAGSERVSAPTVKLQDMAVLQRMHCFDLCTAIASLSIRVSLICRNTTSLPE